MRDSVRQPCNNDGEGRLRKTDTESGPLLDLNPCHFWQERDGLCPHVVCSYCSNRYTPARFFVDGSRRKSGSGPGILSNRADASFNKSIGFRRTKRCLQQLNSKVLFKNLFEAVAVFAVTISQQKARGLAYPC